MADARSSELYAYDVFLSFRGEDTRKAFTDHLYSALLAAGIRTFRDNEGIERGENIDCEIDKGIMHSRSSIIILSENYASSRWCLDELVTILDRKRKDSKHVVLPIFYHVDPSDVRKQKESFAKAFTVHEGKNELKEKVIRWRGALREVADLGGMSLRNQPDGFRGVDTRTAFTDHLYTALSDVGIRMFRDNEGIQRGENVKCELEHGIMDSRCSIIILSEN